MNFLRGWGESAFLGGTIANGIPKHCRDARGQARSVADVVGLVVLASGSERSRSLEK
jgi:hypothetical protein